MNLYPIYIYNKNLQCPALDDMFPFLPPGWLVDWTDDGLVMRPPQLEAD